MLTQEPDVTSVRPAAAPADGGIFADPGVKTSAGAWFARQAGWSPKPRPELPPPLPYVASLDGLRAIAVAGVLVFHSGVGFGGGFLGVSTFFTLSGFLITSVLLARSEGSPGVAPGLVTGDRIRLGSFWSRRFRRLLPAAMLAIALSAILVWLTGDASQLRAFRGDGLAAIFDVANWRFIISGTSYAATTASPSPLLHFWSLAIEEQFYLLFPLVAWGLLRLAKGSRPAFAMALATLLVASALLPSLLDLSQDRVYFGTDTRAAELLAGAFLAVMLAGRGCSIDRIDRRWSRITWSLMALVGMGAFEVMLLLWWFTSRSTPWVYEGGLPLYAGLTVIVIMAALTTGNPVRRILSVRPLVQLGRISYGVYLYHWPIFVWLSPANTGWSPVVRLVVASALTLAIATLSFVFLERPVLERRPPALPSRRPVAPRELKRRQGPSVFTRAMPFAIGGVAALVLAVTVTPAPTGDVSLDAAPGSLISETSRTRRIESPGPLDTAVPRPIGGAAAGAVPPTTRAGAPTATGVAATIPAPTTSARPPATTVPAPAAGPLPTKAVRPPTRPLRIMVVGDSTAGFLDPGLNDWGEATKIWTAFNYARIGCGIGRGGERTHRDVAEWVPAECASWAADWSKLVREQKPDIVVVASGFWDATDRRLLGDDTWRKPGDPVYDEYITREMGIAVDVLAAHGAVVAWIDNPPIQLGLNDPQGPTQFVVNDVARQDRMNELLADVAATRPSMRIIPFAAFMRAWPGGVFDRAIRQDGLHVDGPGRSIVGNWMGPEVLDAYWSVKAPAS